jgi:peptidoglycan hydrolase-like protein with peptidoglycan-binding domain
MNKRSILCLVLLFTSVSVFADDRVRSTQEELRRRNVYFGDVDGRSSRELEQALKRYQVRKGLAATGREDRETLRSLGIVTREQGEPVPKDLEWPEEPVLKSDVKLDVVAAAEEISTTSGVSFTSLVPNRAAAGASRRTTGRRQSQATNAGRPSAQATSFSIGQNGALQRELSTYIRDYLKAVGRNRLEDELHYYADRVDYLGNGTVDRRIIEQSLRNYYQRWPKRSYAQVGEIAYRANRHRGEIVATFRTQFALGNGKAGAKGQTETQITINAATADPRIVAIREHRVRR